MHFLFVRFFYFLVVRRVLNYRVCKMELSCFLFHRRLCVQLGGRLRLRFHHTNDIVGFLVVVGVLLLHILCRWLCFGVASHAPSACASAPPRGLAGMYRVGLLVGFISVAFGLFVVCDLNSNARQSPEGPPSVATLDSLFNSFTHCASALCPSPFV